MKNGMGWVLAAVLAASTVAHGQDSAPAAKDSPMLAQRLVFVGGNFMRDTEVERVIDVIKKSAAAGYNGVLLTDCKFARWDDKVTVDRPVYEKNVQKVRQACRDAKMMVLVSCLDLGTDMLSVEPNLAEGVPVKDAPFVVKDGKLVPADEDCKVANGGFEETRKPNEPTGWNVDFPGKCGFLDTEVKCEGKQSLRYDDIAANSSYTNGRAIQGPIKVKPWRYYHASLMVKTKDFAAVRSFNFTAQGKTNGLAHQTFELKPTQDWTKYDIVFNTLDNTEINLYAGSWGGGKGTLWMDDLKIEAGGFVNLIRRPSLTFKITSEDGATTFEEGKDFSTVRDAKFLNVRWPGDHLYWYEKADLPVVTVPEGSKLKDGQKVLATYSHAMNMLGWGIFACMSEPGTMERAKKNLAAIHKVIEPDAYMLPFDELRHQGFDESCEKTGKTMSQVLIDNTKACIEAIHKEDPGKPIYAWNDMFDPHHNAGKSGYYYIVKGKDPWYGSWEGLDKDVIILNWMSDAAHRKDSMKFFADRGHKQVLAGFYDAPSENMAPWLKEASQVPGMVGVMYTTWANNFGELEKYLKICREVK